MTTTKELKPTIYIGTFIYCSSPKILDIKHTTAIGVDASGKIAFIHALTTPTESTFSIATQHDFPTNHTIIHPPATHHSSFFFPGLIDTHTHASQYPNTGIFGSSTLLDWLNTYTFPLESSFSSLSRARTVYDRAVTRALSHGTTCASYYATVHVPATNLLADICLAKGQRALVGRVCMDRAGFCPDYYRDESAEEGLNATKACVTHCEKIDPHGALVRPVITPRFAPSCTVESLQALGTLHKETGHFVQTHISENLPECALVKELFPESEGYANVYDDVGLLTDKTILAHAVHLTDAEVALVAKRGSGISHCPVSNSSLTSGAAPIRTFLEKGVNVSLGTDVSGGYSVSILDVVRQCLLVSRHVAMAGKAGDKLSVEEALWLGTVGGANVVGLEKKVGKFEVGMEWDAQMICLNVVDEVQEDTKETGIEEHDIGPVDIFGWESWPDRVAKWVYTGDDRNAGAVWVKGRLVHKRAGILL